MEKIPPSFSRSLATAFEMHRKGIYSLQPKDTKGKYLTKANFLPTNKMEAGICKTGFKLPVQLPAEWCPDFNALTATK